MLTEQDWEAERQRLRLKYDVEAFWSSFDPQCHVLQIDFVLLEPDKRGQGRGTRAMAELLAWADKHKVVITISAPASDLDVARLRSWYDRNGFRPMGRSDSMIREPELTEKNSRGSQ